MIEFLLNRSVNINARDRFDKKTPLHAAVEKACLAFRRDNTAAQEVYVDIIKLLITRNADIKAGDKDENTVLHYTGNTNIINLLVEEGKANINAHNKKKNSPLHCVASSGKLNAIKFFIDKGAEVNEKNAEGRTPLHIAARAGAEEAVELLIKCGSEVDLKNNSGATPLLEASSPGQGSERARLALLRHGANPWAKDKDGDSPVTLYTADRQYAATMKGGPIQRGCLTEFKEAYDKSSTVRYSTMVLGAVASYVLFTTDRITLDTPHMIGAVAIVTALGFAAGRITYEIFKPSTKMEEVSQESGQYGALQQGN